MLRALILSGEGSHDWRTTTPFLRQLLLDSGRFDVRVSESPAGLTAKTLAGFDVVMDDYSGPRLGTETEKALEAFVAAGKGLVVTHGGLSASDFAELTKASWPSGAAADADAPFHSFDLRLAHPEHPVMQGLKGNLRTADQPRHGFTLLPGSEILAATGNNEPLLFASTSGKGRVFCTALGHDLGAMQEKTFITTFLRGTEWAASGKVTLPSEIGVPGPDTNGVRVLVIAGGHDHEAAFYGLFDGYKDLGWVLVTDSTLAFKQDIRAKQDVLGGLYRLERQGTIPSSTVKFGEEHLITPAGQHPITAGIGPFHVTDETYKGLFISTNVKPLLVTDNATSDRTVAWIGPCTTSKVVFIQLGHDHSPFRHPSYRALVHNSILWAAGKLK